MLKESRGRADPDSERILPFLIGYGLPLLLFIVVLITVLLLA